MSKKMMRSASDKMVSGVAAGVANYVGIDPVLMRLAFALAILSNPPLGLVIYFLLAVIMPLEGEEDVEAKAHPFSEEEIVVKNA